MTKIKIPKGGHSNKPQTPGKKTPATSPTPFIDKLSVVLKIPEPDGPSLYASLWKVIDDPQLFVDAGSKAKFGHYKIAKRIVLPTETAPTKRPLLQCGYFGKAMTHLRLEFVPVDLGPDGLSQLHFALTVLMNNGWGYIVKHGRITRIDIAVDFPDVKVSDFQFLPLQGATVKQWGVNGKLQTYLHGKKDGNQTLIYDRSEKRKALDQDPTGKCGTRVERRIKNPAHHALAELKTFPNPFVGMNFVGFPGAPPSEAKPYIWQLFCHTAASTSLGTALAMLPEDKRTAYRQHLKAHTVSWWDPNAIWANWSTMLDEMKIASTGW